MCKGFIKIPRRVYEEKLWNVKRVYSELDAFCDIYASAYTRDRTEPDGTKIKRNQFPCSLRSLADKWIWNQMKVKRFIQSLERKGYITIQADRYKTIITILDFGADDTSVTQGVTPTVTPLLQQNPSKQSTSKVVSVTPPVTPPVTLSVTPIYNKEDKKEDNIPPLYSPQGEKKARFSKPTIEELQSYIDEKGYHFSAQAFWNFYESKGWMVGKNHMKNWKAACNTWENKRKQTTTQLPIGFNLNNAPDKYKEEGW